MQGELSRFQDHRCKEMVRGSPLPASYARGAAYLIDGYSSGEFCY
jgi:hypothetical protein